MELAERHSPDHRTLLAFNRDTAIEVQRDRQLGNPNVFA
jgi:hypothetical protein